MSSLARSPEERWWVYWAYLQMKIDEREWHGVAEAALGLRALEDKYPGVIVMTTASCRHAETFNNRCVDCGMILDPTKPQRDCPKGPMRGYHFEVDGVCSKCGDILDAPKFQRLHPDGKVPWSQS